MAVPAWQLQREAVVRRMTSMRSFEDYPGSESGEIHEEPPGNYGGRKPFSPIVEEDEDNTEDMSRRQRGAPMEGVAGGGANKHRTSSSPRSSTSPKQPSLSPSSHSSGSGHSSPRSPPVSYPPPPSSQPPPLPPSQTRGHPYHQGVANSGTRSQIPNSGKRSSDRKYDMHMSQYGSRQVDPTYNGRGMGSKPHPQYPHSASYQNDNRSHSHSVKQPSSGTRMSHSTDVVNSKIIASKQFVTSLSDQSNPESMSEAHPVKPEHVVVGGGMPGGGMPGGGMPGGDLGVRECPSGASSPSGTPNNTLVKSSKISHHNIYDPLASSASMNQLEQGYGGGRGMYPPPQDGLESHSEGNLLNYSYPAGNAGGVAAGRGKAPHLPPHKMQMAPGIKGSIQEWESRGMKPSGDQGEGGGGMVGRVLHPPVSTSGKDRGRGGDQGMVSPPTNGYGEGRGSSIVSPDHRGVTAQPSASDPTRGSSSASNHSLSPLSHTTTSADFANQEPTQSNGKGNKADSAHLEGGMSPSSSAEELMQINDPSEKEVGGDQTDSTSGNTASHQIHKPEPTKSNTKTVPVSANYQAPPTATYINKQAHQQAPPPPNYHPSLQGAEHQPSYPHTISLSQPIPGTIMTPAINPAQGLSQGHTYYHHAHPTSRGGGEAPPPGPHYAGAGAGGYAGPRQKFAYENVTLQQNARHAHLPHSHASQAPPPSNYPGMAQQHQQPGPGLGGYNPRDRSHDPHMIKPHAGPHEYPLMRPYTGSRWKPLNPAVITVAHDAAASGDIATLHHLLTNQEIDAFTFNDHKFSLAHKAALHGQLGVLTFLVGDVGLPLTALQLSDDGFSTPAMLAIQGGHVECVQWMVEEYKVPLEVRDTGGETLMHHAAYNGQVKCLEWLLKAIKKKDSEQHTEILDESGVTPAHFAAQGGHLDCLQLLIDHGYSVVHSDQEGQKPLDWADAMNQTVCVRYLMMYEACWALSAEVTHLSEQLVMIRKEYDKLRETLSMQNQEHQHAMAMLQQSHEERVAKIREQYVDLAAELLKNTGSSSGGGEGGVASSSNTTSSSSNTKPKSQVPARKAPTAPTDSSHKRSSKPPIPPDAAKKHLVRGSQNHEHKHDDILEMMGAYRTVTPQEVMKKQLSSVAQRMTLNREHREHRKHQGGLLPRTYSPITPILQRYSKKDEDVGNKNERQPRPQRHSESHDKRGVPKAVKFSSTITEFPDYSRFDEDSRTGKSSGHPSGHPSGHKFSSGHPGTANHSPGHSPGHSVSGHGNLGQYNDNRTALEGESGHGKNDTNRKLSAEKNETRHSRKHSQ